MKRIKKGSKKKNSNKKGGTTYKSNSTYSSKGTYASKTNSKKSSRNEVPRDNRKQILTKDFTCKVTINHNVFKALQELMEHKELKNTEWAAHPVYVLEEYLPNVKLRMVDLWFQEIGSSSYTEPDFLDGAFTKWYAENYQYTKDELDDDYCPEEEKKFDKYFFGALHSHHDMGAFFSPEDDNDLRHKSDNIAPFYTSIVISKPTTGLEFIGFISTSSKLLKTKMTYDHPNPKYRTEVDAGEQTEEVVYYNEIEIYYATDKDEEDYLEHLKIQESLLEVESDTLKQMYDDLEVKIKAYEATVPKTYLTYVMESRLEECIKDQALSTYTNPVYGTMYGGMGWDWATRGASVASSTRNTVTTPSTTRYVPKTTWNAKTGKFESTKKWQEAVEFIRPDGFQTTIANNICKENFETLIECFGNFLRDHNMTSDFDAFVLTCDYGKVINQNKQIIKFKDGSLNNTMSDMMQIMWFFYEFDCIDAFVEYAQEYECTLYTYSGSTAISKTIMKALEVNTKEVYNKLKLDQAPVSFTNIKSIVGLKEIGTQFVCALDTNVGIEDIRVLNQKK